MKRKVIIELFLYIIVVIVSLIILLSEKPKPEHFKMQPDYEMSDQGGDESAVIPMQ
jgi:hypothetical protein